MGRSVRVVPGVGVGYRSVLSSVPQRYFGDGERRLRWHRSASYVNLSNRGRAWCPRAGSGQGGEAVGASGGVVEQVPLLVG